MKKILKIVSLVLAVVTVICAAGCAGIKKDSAQVALVTDISDIDDKSYNQCAWEGIKKYCEENKVTYKFYRPKFKKTENIIEAIDKAVSNGAQIVICPNSIQAEAVSAAQITHPDVKFVFINGTLSHVENNTYQINFSEVEIGFLAGYAAVKEGYRHLGFQGGVKNTKNENYGFGFIQGAQFAAFELGLGAGAITIKYNYAQTSDNSSETQARVQVWYEAGTQIVFASERGVLASVICVAEGAPNRKVIGCNIDRSKLSSTVVTSSKKLIEDVVYDSLSNFFAGEFKGGKAEELGCAQSGIDIEMKNAKFEKFTYKDNVYIKNVLVNNSSIKDYLITSEMVSNMEIESTSDFATLFPEHNIVVEYIVT